MKIIFNHLNNTINCKLTYNTPKKENNIITIKETDSGYCTILRNPNTKEILLYFRKTGNGKSVHHSNTYVSISTDGITFSEPKKIFNLQCISHNFTPFYDPNTNSFKGIGGLHISKWKGHYRLCKKFNNCEKEQNLKDYPPNKKGGHKIFDPDKEHLCYGGGLYLLESTNGIDWNIINKKPFIHGLHPGQTDGLFQCSEFDGGLSCFYDNNTNEYRLYCRSNVATQHRYIQTASSKDFKEWSDFQLIHTIPNRIKKDNYYYSGFSIYPNTNNYIGITPYSDGSKQNSGLWLMTSHNGLDWNREHKILSTTHKSNRTSQHSVTGFIESNDLKEIYFYIQDNYFKLNGKNPINIVRYSCPIDRLVGVSSIDNEKESIIKIPMKNIKNNSKFFINMKTLEGGHISIKLLDKMENKINKSEKIIGDSINYEIKWRTSRFHFEYLEVLLYKASIYSINYYL